MWLLVTMLMGLAFGYEAVEFVCCHTVHADLEVRRTLSVVIVPPADRRQRLLDDPLNAAEHAKRMGKVRGGYGNPFPLRVMKPASMYVAEALKSQLNSSGHRVKILDGLAPPPSMPKLSAEQLEAIRIENGVDVVLHGVLDEFVADVSSYGSYKVDASLTLVASTGWSDVLTLHLNDRDGGGLGIDKGLKQTSKRWHGKTGVKYISATIVEIGLIELIGTMVRNEGPSRRLFAGNVPEPRTKEIATPLGSSGCGMDTDCKGDRICVKAECVSP